MSADAEIRQNAILIYNISHAIIIPIENILASYVHYIRQIKLAFRQIFQTLKIAYQKGQIYERNTNFKTNFY